MRRILFVVVFAMMFTSWPAQGGVDIVELPVSFEVINQNRSVTSSLCQGDGKTYTVRGSLVGPAGVEAGRIGSVTLYLHGGLLRDVCRPHAPDNRPVARGVLPPGRGSGSRVRAGRARRALGRCDHR